MFGLKGGAVGVPRWILAFRALQFLFAILVIALSAYALSIYRGGPIRPALIATLIIGILTIVPVLLFVAPLHLIQRKTYNPSIALLLDLGALLFWLGAFAALASYQDIYSVYGREMTVFGFGDDGCRKCRRAWKSGVAVTVFAALEFLLFLCTTLIFIYYFHHHVAGTTPGGHTTRYGNHHGSSTAAAETGAAGATTTTGNTTGTTTGATPHSHTHTAGTREYEMTSNPTHNTSGPGQSNYGVPSPPATGGYGGSAAPTASGPGATAGGGQGPPYPDSPSARQGGYGGLEGANREIGAGAENTRH